MRAEQATIAYCVYENPFAKSGGIFAVADFYAQALARRGRQVVVLSPLHRRLATAPRPDELQPVGRCVARFDGRDVEVRLLEHRRQGVRWVLLEAAGFFEADGGAGGTDPYAWPRLLTDSLFAAAALPRAAAALGLTDNVIFHVQDWELAATGLTVKLALLAGELKSAAVVLTSHNPYDQVLPPAELRRLTLRPFCGPRDVHTVYQHMIPLCDGPMTTVSKTFAEELTLDPLQTSHFADHLQGVFRRQGLVGVDNGLFGAPRSPYSQTALDALQDGNPQPLLMEKLEKRETMLRILDETRDERIWGGWQSPRGDDGLPDDVPLFLMFGRLDPGQKGFDLLARAIEALPRGRAKFMLTPIVGGAPQPYVEDLRRLAENRPGDVAIYPFRLARGYMEAMAGASFAVMPSLYEPFGGATEPYLAGTPVVARATGGLVQQVVDLDQDAAAATGLLFREPPQPPEQWRSLQTAEHPQTRLAVPLYSGMVAALAAALTRAGEVYRSQPDTYARLLSNLGPQAASFSWDKTVEEYQRVYYMAAT